MSDACDLVHAHCADSVNAVRAMTQAEIDTLLGKLDGWAFEHGVLTKTFRFPDYWHTMAFVNASAWISHREDHHPELSVGYGACRVEYSTHTVKGISKNDFICAAKLDALFNL